MRIVSMVPSATEILCALGLAKDIVGISHDCDYPAEILNRPRLTGTALRSDLTSYEIDQKVRASAASGHSLYAIQTELLESLHPDLVVTQEQCSVCSVDRDRTVCALESMKLGTKWLSLAATGFSGLYQDILDVGAATGRVPQAETLVAQLGARLERVRQKTASEYRPRVFCLSWFDPLMSAGRWISQMVTLAGGDVRLGSRREASSRIAADQVRGESPEIIFLLPCSFSQNRSAAEWTGLRALSPWRDFPAIREARVFALESSLYHRPGPRLVDGVELMAALIHPRRCSFGAELDLWRKVA
ncbi:MAG TPA: cobalamin-binding protein [Candidatus Dormibacteraeota bacterium]|nr:cobalamin-binding protein [Candidatus Dormibacteraeota bacterium]